MMNCFKYLCVPFLILLSGMMLAQTEECVVLDVDYSVDISETSKLTGEAVITLQGNAFSMSGNGIESYCDGSSLWTLDLVAKEVYVEPLTPDAESYMNDLRQQLHALKDNSEIDIASPEGHMVHARINSIKKSAGKDISSFRPPYEFDASWVITDLR